MNDVATDTRETEAVEIVVLTCMTCGKVEEIYVFRQRRLPGRIYWECFDCQKRAARN